VAGLTLGQRGEGGFDSGEPFVRIHANTLGPEPALHNGYLEPAHQARTILMGRLPRSGRRTHNPRKIL
jgi:hypothetical protein